MISDHLVHRLAMNSNLGGHTRIWCLGLDFSMLSWSQLFRFAAIWTLAIWLGGFTFYAAAVIPVLHDQLGSALESGLVTQQVTIALNWLGVATVTIGLVLAIFERALGWRGSFSSRASLGLIAATALCLVGLFILHPMLDRRLDAGEMAAFYLLHRAYLWVSTVQWVTNSALLASWAVSGTGFLQSRKEKPQVSVPPRQPELPA
jgi:hypothetical protein